MKEDVFEEIIENVSDYLGFIFEDICIDYLIRKNKKKELPFLVKNLGKWWGNNPKEKRQEEIDIVGINKDKVIFAECKYRNQKVGIDVLNSLIEKSFLVNGNEKYYYIFSKTGFKDNLIKIAEQRKDVFLIPSLEIDNIKL